jgi:hypothetical protein
VDSLLTGIQGYKIAVGYVLYSNEEGRHLVMGNSQKTLYFKEEMACCSLL